MRSIRLIVVFAVVVMTGVRIYPAQRPELAADLVIFSYDRPLQLYAFLESVQRYVTGLSKISVICRMSDGQYRQGYEIIQADTSEPLNETIKEALKRVRDKIKGKEQ